VDDRHKHAAGPLALVALIALALACNLPGARSEVPTPTPTLNLETLLAPPATETPTPPGPTPTLEPGVTPTATVCTWAAIWVEDVTYPDGTKVEAGTKFDKTWRMRSNGCLDWPDGTQLAYIGEEKMGGPDTASVGRVAVGATKDITVTLTAPKDPGTYRGLWQLRTPDGYFFGQVVWVQIEVIPVAATSTPTEIAEQEVELQPVAVESGSLTETAPGTTTPGSTVQAGVSATGKRVRGFVSFDISAISGTVTRARLDLSDYTNNAQFEFLKPLLVEQLAYGASFDGADFDATGTLLISASSASALQDKVNVTDRVATAVAGGGSRFQIRLRFQQDAAANVALAGTIDWSKARLIVEYQPD
jgi:hypothetical protein